MNLLYVTSEAVPFAKTGGLADVAGALPQALHRQGATVSVILPLYGSINSIWREQMRFCLQTTVQLAWRQLYCGLFCLDRDGVRWYFVDNEYYFRREAPYGYDDDVERFAFFCQAVVQLLPMLEPQPEIISCNDWQTALIPVLLRYHQIRIPSAFTIHNIEYQGKTSPEAVENIFGMPYALYEDGLLRFDGCVNLLKAALYAANVITTVSPSYATELHDPYFAAGLSQAIADNAGKLHGILNGLDLHTYAPSTGFGIETPFCADDLSGKRACRTALQYAFGLEPDPDALIIGCVSRLVEHKGFDLVIAVLEEIMQRPVQLVILGGGEQRFADSFSQAAQWYSGRLSAHILYSESLSRQIYAGADLFLMPSRSEPCGLAQMIAMRYGTLPLVHAVGGLRDTVCPYPSDHATGFSFPWYDPRELLQALDTALSVHSTQPETWQAMMRRAMTVDFGWERSASAYLELYYQMLRS